MQAVEEWRWMLKDISIQTVYAIHRPIWMGSDEGCGRRRRTVDVEDRYL